LKKKVLIWSVLFFTGSVVYSQNDKNAIKTDPISPFLGVAVLKYERVFTEQISTQLGFYYAWDYPAYEEEEYTASGYAITPEFRYYLSKKKPAPHGIYMAPNYRYQKLFTENLAENSEATVINNSLAFNLGFQLILKDLILIDSWLGLSYNIRKVVDETVPGANIGYVTESGFAGRIGISIGLTF